MKNVIQYKAGEKSKPRFIKRILTKDNSNWLELFEGPSGSGKTWSAIRQCYDVDSDFDVRTQLVFSFPDFMKVINDPEFKKKKWRQVIFDEPQVSISNRAWMQLSNKLFNYLLTTFRHQNIAVIFCCPYRNAVNHFH